MCHLNIKITWKLPFLEVEVAHEGSKFLTGGRLLVEHLLILTDLRHVHRSMVEFLNCFIDFHNLF